MPGSRGNTRPESGNTATALLFGRRQNPAARADMTKEHFLTVDTKEVSCLNHRYKS